MRIPSDWVDEAAKQPRAGITYAERPAPCARESARARAAREAREVVADAVVEEIEDEPQPRRDLPPAARRLVGC